MSEIEKFPRAVLKHHYPEVPLHGDFTTIKVGDYEPIDVLVGGTPCQDFSVAGKRLGMDGARGNLSLEFLALAKRLRPRWMVFENVPGLLSNWSGATGYDHDKSGRWESSENSDFAAFLGAVHECGYSGGWRSLDAQYAGLAQRRERLFFVGYLGDWRPPAAVLFERESLRGDNPPSREAGQNVAGSISARTEGGGGLGTDFELGGGLQVAHSLRADGFDASEDGTGRGTPLVPDIAWALQERDSKGADSNTKDGHLIPVTMPTLRSGANNGGKGHDARSGDTKDEYIIPIAFDQAQITSKTNRSNPQPGDPSFPLHTSAPPVIAFESRFVRNGRGAPSDIVPPLKTQSGETGKGDAAPLLQSGMMVRRLTPIECERLQGFPDDYTKISEKTADGPRYKALGNSFPVPVVRWLGQRIQMVDQLLLGTTPK